MRRTAVALSLVLFALALVPPASGATRTLTVKDASVVEPDSGTVGLVFTVTLSRKARKTVTVAYGTNDGSATSPDDYTDVQGTLKFKRGQKRKKVSVPIQGDTDIEGNETFEIVLSAPTRASLADADATGTIIDDDTAPTPGALVINEIMANPIGTEGTEEYIEILNVNEGTEPLTGLVIWVGTTPRCQLSGTIPGGSTVFVGGNAAYNPLVVCPNLGLVNTGATVSLRDGIDVDATVFDETTYTTTVNGSSRSLDPDNASAIGNDLETNWCNTPAGNIYNGTDLGTPGSVNPQCP